jgi:diguanylate cyclase (GGDEF)-like protein
MLSGLYNRHALFRIWEGKEKETDTTVGLIMLDADKFKEVNDTYKHKAGDEVLEIYRDSIKNAIESMNKIANRAFPSRWGGEEFVVCIYNSNQDEIIELSKKINCELSSSAKWGAFTERYKDNPKKISIPRTISQGIALGIKSEFKIFDVLVNKADEQLSLAKNEGNRNCIYYEGNKVV